MKEKMENIRNLEIIDISTIDGKLVATLSYQDISKLGDKNGKIDVNNGFDTIGVPVNPRGLQLSSRGNMLVNQSIKRAEVVVNPLWGKESLDDEK